MKCFIPNIQTIAMTKGPLILHSQFQVFSNEVFDKIAALITIIFSQRQRQMGQVSTCLTSCWASWSLRKKCQLAEMFVRERMSKLVETTFEEEKHVRSRLHFKNSILVFDKVKTHMINSFFLRIAPSKRHMNREASIARHRPFRIGHRRLEGAIAPV